MGLVDQADDRDGQHDADRYVDIEGPAPAESVGDDATDDRRKHHCEAHDSAPDRPGPCALGLVVGSMANDRERRRE